MGNKSDLVDKEEVDESDAREYSKSVNAIYGRTSALNGSGIKESFDLILKNFCEKINNNNDYNQLNNSIIIKNNSLKEKKGYCCLK